MSTYEQWGNYYRHDGHISHEMLNKAYGDAGMFYKTLKDAEAHKERMGGIIYPISNYHLSQISCEYGDPYKKSYRVVVEPGAKRHLEGYYVSHPHYAAKPVGYLKRVK